MTPITQKRKKYKLTCWNDAAHISTGSRHEWAVDDPPVEGVRCPVCGGVKITFVEAP